MFLINIYLRLGLIAVCLIGGTALAIAWGFWYAFPFLLTGIILLAGYIAFGTVQSAAQLVQTQQFDEAEKRLNLTLKPNWLYMTNRAFYFMIKGSLAMNSKDMTKAEEYFNKAQSIDLPSDNEKAMVELQLANIHASKNKWNAAKAAFQKIKKLKVTQPELKEQIKMFEKAIAQRGQMKHMHGMKGGGRGMRGRKGGFRRM